MSPNVRRELVLGGAISAMGIGLLAFALFAGDESFRAPRWVVGAIAIACLVAASFPLKTVAASHEITLSPTPLGATLTALLLLGGVMAAWVMVAIGPEGAAITFDVPLPISEDAERVVKAVLFHLVFGLIAAACLLGAIAALREAPATLRHTLVVAAAASIAGLVAWIVIEFHRQATQPIAPVVFLSFDRRFPGDGYLVRVNGKEVLARPGRSGMGLFTGGNGDWLELEAPRGYHTGQGLTLEFWMKRENWVNPYLPGSASQTVVTVDLEREWKGHPEVRQVAFFLELHDVRRNAPKKRETMPDAYRYQPQARLGSVLLKPLRPVTIPPDKWTHVAIVYDRFLIDRARLYIDGRLEARAVPWGFDPGFADIRAMRLGTYQERNGAYRGMIDEVKLYARALSDEEIAAAAR
jgi:Concanavalin A-like lectin/glucanases superfamily